jgi:hypothetical protein
LFLCLPVGMYFKFLRGVLKNDLNGFQYLYEVYLCAYRSKTQSMKKEWTKRNLCCGVCVLGKAYLVTMIQWTAHVVAKLLDTDMKQFLTFCTENVFEY